MVTHSDLSCEQMRAHLRQKKHDTGTNPEMKRAAGQRVEEARTPGALKARAWRATRRAAELVDMACFGKV